MEEVVSVIAKYKIPVNEFPEDSTGARAVRVIEAMEEQGEVLAAESVAINLSSLAKRKSEEGVDPFVFSNRIDELLAEHCPN